MSKLLKSLVVLSAIFALGAPAIASAGPQSDLHGTSVKVQYADLNLDKDEGAKALYRRLQNAAKQACGAQTLRVQGSLSNLAESRVCYQQSLDNAVAEIDNARVSSIHTG